MQVPRTADGRPWIVTPEGTMKAYGRASSAADALAGNKDSLDRHHSRLTAKGMILKPGLQKDFESAGGMLAGTLDTSEMKSWRVDEILEKAQIAAGRDLKSSLGTAHHSVAEDLDIKGYVPWDPYGAHARHYQDDIEAYLKALADHHLDREVAEVFVVDDERKLAGTFDGAYRFGANGELYAGDMKTGSIKYDPIKFAVQMVPYTSGKIYRCTHEVEGEPTKAQCQANIEAHERSESGLRTDVGLLIHLPLGEGRCDIYPLNLEEGREGLKVAELVRAWASTKLDDLVNGSFFSSELDILSDNLSKENA